MFLNSGAPQRAEEYFPRQKTIISTSSRNWVNLDRVGTTTY